MKFGFSIFALSIAFLVYGPLSAQQTNDPIGWTEKFALEMKKGPDIANRYLIENSYIGRSRPDAIRGIRENMRQSANLYGSVISSEKFEEIKKGNSILLISQLIKRRDHPVLWRFYFYKQKDKWNLNHFCLVDKMVAFMTMDCP